MSVLQESGSRWHLMAFAVSIFSPAATNAFWNLIPRRGQLDVLKSRNTLQNTDMVTVTGSSTKRGAGRRDWRVSMQTGIYATNKMGNWHELQLRFSNAVGQAAEQH